jgi:hypothetical protein
MGGCYPFDRLLAAYKVFKRFYGLCCDVAHVQIVVSVLAFRVGAEDKTVKETPLFRLINDPVGVISGHFSITAKKRPGDRLAIFPSPMLDVAD